MKATVLPILACLSAASALPLAALSMTGEEVEHLYVEALRTAGAKEDLGLYWSTLLNSGTLDEGARRQVLHEMLEGGAEAAALPYLAQEASSSEEWLFAYAEAAERVGARAELARFLTAELSRRELSSAERELRRSLLVEKAAAEAAPLLAPVASGDPLLASTYQDVLEALGRKRELAAFLLARAADRELPAAERLSLGWRLLELGEKPAAEAALMVLASRAEPNSAEVEQLLFLWGPRPPAAALDWLESRVEAAAGDELAQAAWLTHLLHHGGAERVARLTARAGAGPLTVPRLRALAELGDKAGLAAGLERAVVEEREPGRLLQIAEVAAQQGQVAVTERAVRAILAQGPAQPQALLRLGLLAQSVGRFPEAAQALQAYLAGEPGDAETYMAYGDSLAALSRGDDAARAYRSALAQLDASDASFSATLTRARLFGGMGDREGLLATVTVAARMVTESAERAELARLLLQFGEPAYALEILGES